MATLQLSPVLRGVPAAVFTPVASHEPMSALIVTFAGQVIVGGSVSLTVTVKLQFELLPDASVAVHTTVVVSLAKLDPPAGIHTIGPPTQVSLNFALKLTMLEHCPAAS